MPSSRRPRQSQRKLLEVHQIHESALVRAVAQMLTTIEDQRALLEVQRVTNGHELSDTFALKPDGTEVSYLARAAELDGLEANLVEDTPPSRLKAARELAGLADEPAES